MAWAMSSPVGVCWFSSEDIVGLIDQFELVVAFCEVGIRERCLPFQFAIWWPDRAVVGGCPRCSGLRDVMSEPELSAKTQRLKTRNGDVLPSTST